MPGYSPTVTEVNAEPLPDAAIGAALEAHAHTLSGAKRVFVGFSGGLDSSVLLHALARRSTPALCALHANHALQDAAADWQAHCAQVCAGLAVPLQARQLQIEPSGQGLEAAARDARYHWFASVLEPGDVLLLAHHQDDQVETLLLRLLRGAGPEGLGAMRPSRSIGSGVLIRPLLSLPRAMLAQYAKDQGVEWIEDASNSDTRFDRNFLRADIMPRLATRWPGYRKTVSRAAQQIRELVEAVPSVSLDLRHSVIGDPGFALKQLPAEPLAAARAVRGWLGQQGLSMPSAARLAEFMRQLREGKKAQLATPNWVLERYRDDVFAYLPLLKPAAQNLAVDIGAEQYIDGCGVISVTISNDAETVAQGPMFVHLRQGGERLLRPDGHHKSLKSLYQEAGVPPWWRARLPLLCCTANGPESLLAVGSLARSPLAVDAGIGLDWRPPLPGRRLR